MERNGNDLSGLVEPRHRWREEGGSPALSLSLIPERRGRASGAVRPPVSSQGRPPPLQFRSQAAAARARTQRRCPLTPRTAHHTPLAAVLQSAARARCTGPTCGRRYKRRGSTRGSAPTTSNAPPTRGIAAPTTADDQAQRMTPGKRCQPLSLALGTVCPSRGVCLPVDGCGAA